MSQLRAGSGGQLDMANACGVQSFGRCSQRRTGRDDVVDDQHHQTEARTPRPERRANETVGTRFAGLWLAMGPVQQPAARNTQLAGNGLGDRFSLVITASSHPAGTRRRPGDHIDVVEAQSAHHVHGKDTGRGSAVTELEGDDQLPCHTLEREGGGDAVGAAHRLSGGKSETAAVAEHAPEAPAGIAPAGKEHGAINTRGV